MSRTSPRASCATRYFYPPSLSGSRALLGLPPREARRPERHAGSISAGACTPPSRCSSPLPPLPHPPPLAGLPGQALDQRPEGTLAAAVDHAAGAHRLLVPRRRQAQGAARADRGHDGRRLRRAGPAAAQQRQGAREGRRGPPVRLRRADARAQARRAGGADHAGACPHTPLPSSFPGGDSRAPCGRSFRTFPRGDCGGTPCRCSHPSSS